jgi:hypothetical protein
MRFSIRDLLWATLVVAMGLAWWIDHEKSAPRTVELRFYDTNPEAFCEGYCEDREKVAYVFDGIDLGCGRQACAEAVARMSRLPPGSMVRVEPRLNQLQRRELSLPQLEYPYCVYADLCARVRTLQRVGGITVDEDSLDDWDGFSLEKERSFGHSEGNEVTGLGSPAEAGFAGRWQTRRLFRDRFAIKTVECLRPFFLPVVPVVLSVRPLALTDTAGQCFLGRIGLVTRFRFGRGYWRRLSGGGICGFWKLGRSKGGRRFGCWKMCFCIRRLG